MSTTIRLILLSFSVFQLAEGGIAITSGSVTGSVEPKSPIFGQVSFKGTDLSVTASSYVTNGLYGVYGALNYTHNGNDSITFNPLTSLRQTGWTVQYKGVTCPGPAIAILDFVALQTTLPNGATPIPGDPHPWAAAVSNIPFSMSGSLTCYASQNGPVQYSLEIEGSGSYSAWIYGGVGGVVGTATYQFNAGGSLIAPYGIDSKSQGSWVGKFGGDGYIIPNGPVVNPAYAVVGVRGATEFTYALQTTDFRALQNGNSGIASAYTQYQSKSFEIDVTITDGAAHRIAFYLMDWDHLGRQETITIADAATGATLSQTDLGFVDGIYVAWTIRDAVGITVTPHDSLSPVVNGIFFGSPSAPPLPPAGLNTAVYTGIDATTQGAWPGVYGSNGYLIANGPATAPAYAVASVSGAFSYTWAGQTSDMRALRNGSSGIASAFTQYSGGNFTININVNDANAHSVALYLLDWERLARSQTITIRDASSNILLDSRTFTGFQNGVYVILSIKGDVTLTVSANGAYTPVISGIFFN